MKEFNQRHAIRFPVEAHRRSPVLIEQRIIRVIAWIVFLFIGWPVILADKYTGSTRYLEARHIEEVDFAIWFFALAGELVWVLTIFTTAWILFGANGT